MCYDLKVRSLLGRVQISHGGTAPASVSRCQLEKADAFLIGSVVIRVELVAGRLRSRHPRVGDRALDTHVRYPKRSLIAVKLVRPTFIALGALEQGQDIVPSPTAVAHLPPPVVVLGLTTNVKQAVERRRTAKNLAARPFDGAPVQAWIRFGLVAPVYRRVVNRFEISHRNMDPRVQVPPTRFEKNNLVFRVGTQPICKYATG